jgi:hypothetical protein
MPGERFQKDINRPDFFDPNPPEDDARFARAWRVWLAALAHDSEAAYAAAITYRSLDVEGREAWIEALEVDAPNVGAPAIALYAPLIGVEEDANRRARLEAALARQSTLSPPSQAAISGLYGETPALRVLVIVKPLYLEFVEVLTCTLDKATGCFRDVECDPLRRGEEAPIAGDLLFGATLENEPIEPVIEELSLAVLAQKRSGAPLHPALKHFVDLFAPRPEVVDTALVRKKT